MMILKEFMQVADDKRIINELGPNKLAMRTVATISTHSHLSECGGNTEQLTYTDDRDKKCDPPQLVSNINLQSHLSHPPNS